MAAVAGIPRRRFALLAGLALAWLCTCGAFGGCDMFKPAEPEPSSSTVILGNFTDPESTLVSMVYAIRARGKNGGADVYRAALADSQPPSGDPDGRAFHAFFDAVTASRYQSSNGTSPPLWTRDRETAFYQTYFVGQNTSSTYDLLWSRDESQGNEVNDPAYSLFHRRYLVTARTGSIIDTVASGFANLELIKKTSRWVLLNWQDRIDPAQPEDCMGQLRLDHP